MLLLVGLRNALAAGWPAWSGPWRATGGSNGGGRGGEAGRSGVGGIRVKHLSYLDHRHARLSGRRGHRHSRGKLHVGRGWGLRRGSGSSLLLRVVLDVGTRAWNVWGDQGRTSQMMADVRRRRGLPIVSWA